MYRQWGLSFIEVLISLLLLSIILFGLDATQMIALQEAKGAYYFSMASQQLLNMAIRLEDIQEVDKSKEINIWNAQNQEVLPKGIGILNDNYPFANLAIFWGGATEITCKNNKAGQSGCLYFER